MDLLEQDDIARAVFFGDALNPPAKRPVPIPSNPSRR
jgi:hypothetical protein